MSKHEKHVSSASEEQRRGQASSEGTDGFDDLAGAEELLTSGLTVAKEIKIGIAVIVVLVVVLGAVVIKRMRQSTNSTAKPAVETEVAKDAQQPATVGSAGKEAPSRQDGAGFASATRLAKPTVVAALPGPGPEAKPRSPSTDPDPWALASDRRSKGGWGQEGHASPSASFMPKMTEVAPSERLSAGTSTRPRGASSVGWVSDLEAAASGASPRPADPFRDARSAAEGRRDVAVAGRSLTPISGPPGPSASDGASRASGLLLPSTDSRAPSAPSASGPLSGSTDQRMGPRVTPRFGNAGSSRPGGDAARRPDGTYVVQPHENYWSISLRLFGTGAYAQALAEHNRKKYPHEEKLQAGDVILAPTASELEKLYPWLCPTPRQRDAIDNRAQTVSASGRIGGGKVYVVQEGDTLYDIARHELGKASRWAEIYELNKDALGNQLEQLKPGMQLILPEAGSAATTQRTESGLRR